jgi:hypothetical protein
MLEKEIYIKRKTRRNSKKENKTQLNKKGKTKRKKK